MTGTDLMEKGNGVKKGRIVSVQVKEILKQLRGIWSSAAIKIKLFAFVKQ